MPIQRQKNSTTYALPFFMASGVNPVLGLTPTITISKNNGAFAAALGTPQEVANGWYILSQAVADVNTIGTLYLHATGANADNADAYFEIVSWDPFTANGATGGSGDVLITHDTISTDNFRVLLGGNPIADATITAYLTTTPGAILGQVKTTAAGRWAAPIKLTAPASGTLNFTILTTKPGTIQDYTSTITVDSTGAVTAP